MNESKQQAFYHLLFQDKDAIESDAGIKPRWGKPWGFQIGKKNVDPLDEKQWDDMQDWMVAHLEGFYKALAPRVKSINESEYIAQDEEIEL